LFFPDVLEKLEPTRRARGTGGVVQTLPPVIPTQNKKVHWHRLLGGIAAHRRARAVQYKEKKIGDMERIKEVLCCKHICADRFTG
jgi:hypothetical protein